MAIFDFPKNSLTWPKILTVEPYQTLEIYQLQKTSLVACACFVFFSLYFPLRLTTTAGIVLTCSTLTLLSETFLPKNDSQNIHWDNTSIASKLINDLGSHFWKISYTTALLFSSYFMPFQTLSSAILAGNVKLIFMVMVISPIIEEILFRGFIQERIEDLGTLVNQYVYSLSPTTIRNLSTVIQSVFFGALHIIGGQVIKDSMKPVVFGLTSLAGFALTHLKYEHQSLLAPIGYHIVHNSGLVLGLFGGSALIKFREQYFSYSVT